MYYKDEESLKDFGRTFAGELKNGDTVAISGELGAGKTTLIRAICDARGVDERLVDSPTFIIVNVYSDLTNNTYHHIDLYRVENEQEFFERGLTEYIEDDSSIVFIEWADRFPELIKGISDYWIEITKPPNGGREVTVEKHKKF